MRTIIELIKNLNTDLNCIEELSSVDEKSLNKVTQETIDNLKSINISDLLVRVCKTRFIPEYHEVNLNYNMGWVINDEVVRDRKTIENTLEKLKLGLSKTLYSKIISLIEPKKVPLIVQLSKEAKILFVLKNFKNLVELITINDNKISKVESDILRLLYVLFRVQITNCFFMISSDLYAERELFKNQWMSIIYDLEHINKLNIPVLRR
ncbi:MAG: hypothetical protein EKK61_00045 [Rickettsiales bacterium]|nr:MAG: hypothetical protein EKK61_00045 [Rickettsiales bacterium]